MHMNEELNAKTADSCWVFCINMQKPCGYVPVDGAFRGCSPVATSMIIND
jgi:hypothetical protein